MRFTNKTGSNLNFNLYKGGKRKQTKKHSYRKKGGMGNWFIPKRSESVKHITNECENTCEKETSKMCKNICKTTAIESANENFKIDFGSIIKNLEKDMNELKIEKKKIEEENVMLKAKLNANIEANQFWKSQLKN
jgi:hypothetical protein